MAKGNSQKCFGGSARDFEAKLWAAADKMRGHMDTNLKANLIPVRKNLAISPFNMSDWVGETLRQNVRWNFLPLLLKKAKSAKENYANA